jgi:hypothetical protein
MGATSSIGSGASQARKPATRKPQGVCGRSAKTNAPGRSRDGTVACREDGRGGCIPRSSWGCGPKRTLGHKDPLMPARAQSERLRPLKAPIGTSKITGRCQSCSPSTRMGEEEVRVLSSPKCAPDAGPEHDALRGLNATAQAADFRHGMKDYLVANVARGQRAVENSAVLISGRHVVRPRPLRCRTRGFALIHLLGQAWAPPVGLRAAVGGRIQQNG